MLDDKFRAATLEVSPAIDGEEISLTVPANYGPVWVKVA